MPTTTANLYSLETVNQLVVEPLFATSVALSSGLTRVNTSATKYYIPVVSGGSASWPVELAEIADSGVNANELEVVPKRCAALQVVSNQSADDAGAAELLGRALVASLADQIDKGFFAGVANGPSGLPAVSGVTPITANPALNLDWVPDAIAAIEAQGGKAGAIYCSPATWAALSKLKTQSSGSNQPVLSPQAGPTQGTSRSLFGVPVFTSRQIADSGGTPTPGAWVIDTSRVVVVVRDDPSVEADKSAKFTADGTAVRAVVRLEFGFPYPSTIAKVHL